MRAVAETSSLVAASSTRTINESGQAVLARVFGVTSDASQWRRELRPAEVREMAMLPDLWRNPQLMMAWALKRGVFKFELQWREFIETQLQDATTWQLLQNSGYVEMMRSVGGKDARSDFSTTAPRVSVEVSGGSAAAPVVVEVDVRVLQ